MARLYGSQQILEAVTFEVIDAARRKLMGQKLENYGPNPFSSISLLPLFIIASCKSFSIIPTVFPHIIRPLHK